MIPVPMEQVKLTDDFWGRWTETVRTRLIPYQWEALNDRVEGAAPSHCIRNLAERSFRTAMWQNG